MNSEVILNYTKTHLNQHVFREHVEVLARMVLWIALPSTARSYCSPVIIEA